MSKIKKYPSKLEIEKYFSYSNGKLFWKIKPHKKSRIKIGDEAGSLYSSGYKITSLNKERYAIHRLIWILNNQELSVNLEIDHINGNRVDNRIENLRIVTHKENQQNQKPHREGKVLFSADVTFCKRDNIYTVRKRETSKKANYYGQYKTQEEAKEICRFINSGEAVYFLAASINKRINYERL